MIFIQLPTMMPLPKHSAKIESGETASSSKPLKPTGPSSKACSLKELPSGFMGKMLVYKSGAVKLKLGDHLYNVSIRSCYFDIKQTTDMILKLIWFLKYSRKTSWYMKLNNKIIQLKKGCFICFRFATKDPNIGTWTWIYRLI